MPEPIRVHLSPYSIAQLNELEARKKIIVETIIGTVMNPADVANHVASFDGQTMILTPPAEA